MITISLSAIAAILPSALQVLMFALLLVPVLLATILITANGNTTSKYVDRNCGIAVASLAIGVFVVPNYIQFVK